MGCPNNYNPIMPCQCNSLCAQFGNCCLDAHTCSKRNLRLRL
jgi:hypothetical protein